MKAIAIVAHDDDIVFWMGGTIRLLNDWDWYVVSMCNACNEDRKRYFHETSRRLGATADTFDFLDYQSTDSGSQRNSISDMKQKLLSFFGNNRFDYVFTHSRDQNGEYGFHANHQEVCEVVESMVSEKRIVENRNKIAYFCYSPFYGLPGLPTVARQDAKFYMQLSYSNLAFKIRLIQSHKKEIVNNLQNDLCAPCPNPEAFDGDNLCLPDPFISRNI